MKNDPAPAFQLRRYAYSAKLPVSILTDFEEFIVYDTTLKPAITDKTHVGRMLYYTYQEYAENWESIQATFSKEAVLRGDFERFIQSKQGKKPRAEIDRDFLNDLDNWRILLARNIALRNPNLSERELNYAVQFTIDRLIFLRMSEDRGIETQYPLQSLLNGERVYQRLVEIYYRADERYNSGLFHFNEKDGANPDTITPTLTIDDKLLKEIVRNLYYPDCPYEFSVLPVEVLGNAYEQFLGKRISLTAGHHARIEEKPEVRKAGGVYYTPQYIVDYIVKNTVGKLLENKTPTEVSELRILDPACGSGSFLLGAYQYLMDWHLEYYRKEYEKTGVIPVVKAEKGKRKAATQAIFSGKGGDWFLSTAEKKRILLNNLYGVDIDANAVEVTKLSLLLKVLENENSETLARQLGLWHERALPNLANNIKCGNSLIGPDYYEQQQANLFDEKEALRINVFDWEKEFPEIFSRKDAENAKGFDAVIGNPPWGAEFTQEEKEYFRKRFEAYHVRTPESFNYFVGQMWTLTNQRGSIGVIIPSSFLNQHEFWKTRKLLVETAKFFRICIIGDGVFKKVTAPSCILVFGAGGIKKSLLFFDFRKNDRNLLPTLLEKEYTGQDASQVGKDSDSYILQVHGGGNIIQKCNKWPRLRNIAEDVATGVSSGLDKAYVYMPDQVKNLNLEFDLLRKLIIGGEIGRYWLRPESGRKIIYITPEEKIEKYPQIQAVLLPCREQLKLRREAANGKIPWYSLNWPRRKKLFEQPKILIRQTADHIMASYDTDGWYCLKSGIIVQLPRNAQIRYEYLLGLLNSRLVKYLYDELVGEQARVFPEVKPVQLFKLPIRAIDFSNPADKAQHDRIVALVETMLALHKRLPEVNTPQEKDVIQRQITATDAQIDKLVYQLYGLTEEEIKVVENV
ncbi:MAG: N-6 DNA methylase [archaeon]